MSKRRDYTFREEFQREIEEEIEIGPDIRFYLQLPNPKKVFVFVEGSTDKVFYNNASISFLDKAKSIIEYVWQEKTREKELYGDTKIESGKKFVIAQIKEKRSKEELSRCWFIFDKDFDSGDIRNLYGIKKEASQQVRVTDGHSMESFFVNEENLKLICNKYGADYDDLYEKLCLFRNEMVNYYALKKAITTAITRKDEEKKEKKYKKYSRVKYSNIYDTKDNPKPLLEFDFSSEDFMTICRIRIEEECEAMKKAIQNADDPYFRGTEVKLIQKRINESLELSMCNMRGHDLFTFLEAYFEQVKGVKLGDWPGSFYHIRDLIKDFEVTLLEI